jgi:hypothetical protein
MKLLLMILGAWIAVSFPLGCLVGRFIHGQEAK